MYKQKKNTKTITPFSILNLLFLHSSPNKAPLLIDGCFFSSVLKHHNTELDWQIHWQVAKICGRELIRPQPYSQGLHLLTPERAICQNQSKYFSLFLDVTNILQNGNLP